MVSFNGCVLATKISGTSASTSIAPEIFETSKDFAESVKLTFLFLIISSSISIIFANTFAKWLAFFINFGLADKDFDSTDAANTSPFLS